MHRGSCLLFLALALGSGHLADAVITHVMLMKDAFKSVFESLSAASIASCTLPTTFIQPILSGLGNTLSDLKLTAMEQITTSLAPPRVTKAPAAGPTAESLGSVTKRYVLG